jgi:hypothetical protein
MLAEEGVAEADAIRWRLVLTAHTEATLPSGGTFAHEQKHNTGVIFRNPLHHPLR